MAGHAGLRGQGCRDTIGCLLLAQLIMSTHLLHLSEGFLELFYAVATIGCLHPSHAA